MKKIISYTIFILLNISVAFAELIKPNNEIHPSDVVDIQLTGLMNNDNPSKNYGIKQTWEFAHPANKKYTGPLPKFINMINDCNKLLQLISQLIVTTEVFKSINRYGFEVTILALDKKYYKFQWVVEKYYEDGPLKDCWLTTSVSNPISLGSSI